MGVESENRVKMRKSLVFNSDLKQGDIITFQDIGIKRPGSGMSPKEFENIVGKRLKTNVSKDELINLSSFEGL